MKYQDKINHWIENEEVSGGSNETFPKYNPATGQMLTTVTKGTARDVAQALEAGVRAKMAWAHTSLSERATILSKALEIIAERKDELADIIALESGKSKKLSQGEVGAVIACGTFFIQNTHLYNPETIQSSIPNRQTTLERHPVGLGALITPFNNPGAGIAWKLFPALMSGNTVIIKSHEYTPYVAVWFARVCKDAGLPAGVIGVLQGLGDTGAMIVADERVEFVSFTGSRTVGSHILTATAPRLTKVSIEAGGKNPFVVCEDANIEKAATIATQAAFIDGGQRCAATSRIIILDAMYEEFKKRFLEKVSTLTVGIEDACDYGAIISEERLTAILSAVETAEKGGATLLCGGTRSEGAGYFMAPTVFENISKDNPLSMQELFGPVVALYRVANLEEAIALANHSVFKLSGAIHTKDMTKARLFIDSYISGVVRVNGPTHGSEPHMPFGGVGLSGNGWREPGSKALDFYSDWKQISIDTI